MPVFIPNKVKGLPQNITTTEQHIRDILKKADSNGDGFLSKDELKKAFMEFGSMIPAWRASRCLRKADTNHDGKISAEELDNVVDYVSARFKLKK